MGKVISIINQKGGSGKTTTATNKAAVLNAEGYKVLLIDLDAQCNSSFNVGCIDYKERANNIISLLFAILNKQAIPKEDEYIFHSESGIDLIPSSSTEFNSLSDIAASKAGGLFLLKKFIKKENLSEKYDYIIIDNNGYLGSMYQNSILASTEVIIPATANTFDLQGMFELINSVQDIVDDEDLNVNEIIIDGILITNDEPNTQVSKEVKESLSTVFKNIRFYKTSIPHSQDVRKSIHVGQILCNMKAKSKAKDAYFSFVEEYLNDSN